MADMMSTTNIRNPCANPAATGNEPCKRDGTMVCANCRLVVYCSSACQKAHWRQHKKDCHFKDTWKPHWAQGGTLSFMVPGSVGRIKTTFGGSKYLWGNVPALDIARLSNNEGNGYAKPLNLLFAASGDLRNVVMTVAHLPASYYSPLTLVINDEDIDVVARNALLLLVFLVVDEPQTAAEHAVHIWYSAFITKTCHETLVERVKPLVQDVCDKIAGRAPGVPQGKTWKFGQRSLRFVLTKETWNRLLSLFDVPRGLTRSAAQSARTRITCAPERVDFVDKRHVCQAPEFRASMDKFRREGLVLPFGHSGAGFDIPNPTLFQSAAWPLMDDADPVSGWDLKTVLAAVPVSVTNDIYGKLYHFLVNIFVTFQKQLKARPTSFQMYHMDTQRLPTCLGAMKFARVEASNIADAGHVGVEGTLTALAPLLQRPSENRHATLITLFISAVQEVMLPLLLSDLDHHYTDNEMAKVLAYLPEPEPERPDLLQVHKVKVLTALAMVKDLDRYFDIHMGMRNVVGVAATLGMAMKEKHTIIDKWPMRFKFGPPTPESEREFAFRLGSSCTGQERYVEWKVSLDNDLLHELVKELGLH